MDKDLSKHLFRPHGVATADWLMATDRSTPPSAATSSARSGLPVIVKPSKQGSTVGLSIVKQPAELGAAIAEAFEHDDEVMIEQFIAGRELTVGILGDEALPVGEIIPKHEIYDYECKYTAGMAEEIFPAPTDGRADSGRCRPRRGARSRRSSSAAARASISGCRPTGEFYCLEANTLPGMTATSLIPQAAAAAGISFPELCERIAQLAVDAADDGGRRSMTPRHAAAAGRRAGRDPVGGPSDRALGGTPAALRASSPAIAETATMYTADALRSELARLTQRSVVSLDRDLRRRSAGRGGLSRRRARRRRAARA